MELDEEDSHLCIRCNQTIIGLQNYVNHRQRNCSSSSSQIAKPSPKPFSTNFDFLDTHGTKKIENYADFHFGDERDDDDDEMDEAEGRNEKSAKTEYDYDFFSSLELQYMSKREMPPHEHQTGGKTFNQQIQTRKAATVTKTQGDEWIDEPTDKKVFKYYAQHETETEDDSDESEPEVPRNYTRGKWKPGSRPPNNFTGGKWKPDSKIPIWDENESSNDANLDKSLEIDDSNPPPSHTKGKWVPGTKIHKLEFKDENVVGEKSLERDNFWCSFCERNLATRAIYDRHLKSNLHRKRTRQQNDLEEAAESLPLTNLEAHFTETTTSGELVDRVTTSTPLITDEELCREGENRRKKFRSRSKVTCEVCDMKLPLHLLGNHLISHFHYRKMLQHPKKSFDIVLENFHKIIIQSPFQCHPCKFYFNTQEEFMRHWNSIGHVEVVDEKIRGGGGKFLCSLCKFECVDNGDMTRHLEGSEHQQVVTLINRSKPIVIRRLTSLKCSKCLQEFRYNIQLMHHLKTCEVAAGNKFNFAENFICDSCPKAFQSALSLQKHQLKAHKTSVFFCSECEKTFKTAKEAKRHRATTQHKSLASRKRMLKDPQLKARLRKVCPICGEEKLDVLELKDHLFAAHPERKFR
jgi:Zinc-finger double-stranded RNA-binding